MAVKNKSAAKAGSKPGTRMAASAITSSRRKAPTEPGAAVLWMAVLFTALCIVFVVAATWRYA